MMVMLVVIDLAMAVVPLLLPSDGSYRQQQKTNGSVYKYRRYLATVQPLTSKSDTQPQNIPKTHP